MDTKQLAKIKARLKRGEYYVPYAPDDINALVAEVERFKKENKHLKGELREWENMTPEEAGEMLAGM